MDNKNVLIVSHQARLRCLSVKLFNASNQYHVTELSKKMKKCRWQNCCVLKLELIPIKQTDKNICKFTITKKGGVLQMENQTRIFAIDISKHKIYNIDPGNNNIQWEYPISAVKDVKKSNDKQLSFDVGKQATQTITFQNSEHLILFTKLINSQTLNETDKKLLETSCVYEPRYTFTLSLLYSGQISSGEGHARDYWGDKYNPNDTNDKNIYNTFNPLDGAIALRELSDIFSSNNVTLSLNMLTFYLVRHGQAVHNTKEYGKIFRKKDTSLTVIGEVMAVAAGEAINKISQKLDYLYVSDLKRTHQTLLNIVKNIEEKNLPIITAADNTKSMTITVLPCAHELKFIKDNGSPCDLNTLKLVAKFTKENEMSCTKSDRILPTNAACNLLTSEVPININWNFYDTFYNESNRTDTNQTFCKNTSMIEQCIKHIIELTPAQPGGMKRHRSKRKTNRKTHRKPRHTKIYKYSKRLRV